MPDMEKTERRNIAVIGSGVAGLTAAHVLSRGDRVTLYEADDRLGGHAHTHRVELDTGTVVDVDTGFIVHNDRTYPTLLRLFDELGVRTQESDMSMSVRNERSGLEYAGAKGVRGLFPTARNFTRPRYVRMLGEVLRFHRRARALLDGPDTGEALAEFLARHDFSEYFMENFMTPLVAAVWSCDPENAGRYPARYLFTFLDHHGMLSVFGSPTWRTVTGGSARYVELVADGLDEVLLSTRVQEVRRGPDGVLVVDDSGNDRHFDAAVIAVHPHQALAMLAPPTRAEADILGAMPYSVNHAQLHTDTALLPHTTGARASWNYLTPAPIGDEDIAEKVIVTYDMTRLMRIDAVRDRRFLVTLGGAHLVDPSTVIAEMTYEHPLYTPDSVAARERLDEVGSSTLAFAGAYHGWGFHEDGALSGLHAAEKIGGSWNGTRSGDGSETADRGVSV
ncbi:NAD(P)/FAD-dependent oxidoreductase [Rhodococcus sp. NPDC058521]|uniref:NAD(P)/FAD-dependent oxidoreductase n=1 Tax=Rhodococcus sp. NPDC058521 TaxID=3346536 RepID=UPI00366816BD